MSDRHGVMMAEPGIITDRSLPGLKRAAPPFYFMVLSFVIWGRALFGYGFVLLGDMVFTPAMYPSGSMLGPPRGLMSVTLVFNIVHVFSRVLSGMLVQKIILFLTVFLAGLLMYYWVPCKTAWGKLFAGTLYIVNPFIYVRLLMGHWGFVLGYALIPVVIRHVQRVLDEPNPANASRCGLWLGVVAVISSHCGVMAVIIALLMWFFNIFTAGNRRKRAVYFVAALLIFTLLSSFWILPAFQSEGLESAIDRSDLEAFQTQSTSAAGVGVSVLGMYGFWKNKLDPLLPRSGLPLWPAFTAIFAALSIIGLVFNWRNGETGAVAKVMLAVFIIGFFLSLGSRAPLTGGLFGYLFDHFPVIKMFREPQKFTALIALSYSVLGALGLEKLLMPAKRDDPRAGIVRTGAFILVILLVFAYSYRMLGGLWGEAKPVKYPGSWSEARKLLDNDRGDFKVLFLPPYWYMRFDFEQGDRTVASPLPYYFSQPGIPLFRVDVGRFKLNEQSTDRYVRSALREAENNSNLGALLAPLNVKYIIFARSDGSEYLEYVLDQNDLKVVKQWPDLVLLENKADAPHLSLAFDRGTYRSWAEVGRVAGDGVLLGSYLEEGEKTYIPERSGLPLREGSSSTNKIEFRFPDTIPPEAAAPGETWLLLGEPYDKKWSLNGASPLEQLGVTCAFQIDSSVKGNQVIEYKNGSLAAGYIISLASLLVSISLVMLGTLKHRHGKVKYEEQPEPEDNG
ncbi:MAG: hypothetical protein JXA49_00895 [Actinobacteria bacterium]|nr:hypothetical protein [Actinomycetota bacterium]